MPSLLPGQEDELKKNAANSALSSFIMTTVDTAKKQAQEKKKEQVKQQAINKVYSMIAPEKKGFVEKFQAGLPKIEPTQEPVEEGREAFEQMGEATKAAGKPIAGALVNTFLQAVKTVPVIAKAQLEVAGEYQDEMDKFAEERGLPVPEDTEFEKQVNKVVADSINSSISTIGEKQEDIYKNLSPTQRKAYSVASGFTSMASALFIGFVTKNPKAAAAFLAATESSDVYLESRAAGNSAEQARADFGATAVGTYFLEKLPMDYMMGNSAPILKRIVTGFLAEGAQESTQQVWQNWIAKRNYDEGRGLLDGVVESFLVGGLVGGTVSTFMPSYQKKITQQKKEETNKLVKNGMPREGAKQVVDEAYDYVSKFTEEAYLGMKPFFGEARMAGLRGPEGGKARPGIEQAAPIDVKPEERALLEEAKKYKNADEFVNSDKIKTIGTPGGRQKDYFKQEVNLADLILDEQNLKLASENVKKGEVSITKSPLVVGMDIDTGRLTLFDGYHRYVQNKGEGVVKAYIQPTERGEFLGMADIWNKANLPKTELSGEFAYMRGPEGKPGLRPGIEVPAPLDMYQANYELNAPKRIAAPDAKGFTRAVGKIADKYVGTISSRLANVNEGLKTKLRRMEFDTRQVVKKDTEKAVPFLDKVKTMEKKDRIDFDLARKNGDVKKINELVDKYDMRKEYDAVRGMLDNAYKKLEQAGYKIGYKENYFPRVVKDAEGFLDFFRNSPDWPVIQQAIQSKEMELKRNLDTDEKAQLVNTLLRGFRSSNIGLSEISAAKARTVRTVTPELNQFYMDTDASLLRYITAANESIEARKFFGKGNDVSVEDSIGMYVMDLVQKGEITPSQEVELTNVLKARFNPRGPGKYMNVFKNLSYMGAMGSPSSAITQIGDLAFVLYKAGAVKTAKGIYKTVTGKSKYTKEDLGIEQMAQEFADQTKTGKAVTTLFRAIGLEAMDTFGKNNLINSVLDKYKSDLAAGDQKATARLEKIFGEEAQEVASDIANGVDSENVKFLAFYELSEVQPITLSEVPEGYLTGGNGRVFYMLKTYTIKLFDVYRNEVFKEIASGDPKRVEQGTKNLVRLTGALMLMNASADFLKDFLFGRNVDLEDIVVDNIFKLFGVSRYITWQARTEGLYSAISKQILPPFSFVDNAGKDIYKMFSDPRQLREEGFESAQTFPVVGKLYYWWLGKGQAKSEKKQVGGSHAAWKIKQDSREEMLSSGEKDSFKSAIKEAVSEGDMTADEAKKLIRELVNNQKKVLENEKIIDKLKEKGVSGKKAEVFLQGLNTKGVITKTQVEHILDNI